MKKYFAHLLLMLPFAMTEAKSPKPEDTLTITLKDGPVVIELFSDKAPKHVERIKKQVREIGNMIIAQLELACVEVGTGSHLFSLDFATFAPLLTRCRIRSTWEFIDKCDIDLYGTYSRSKLQREGDEFLMERLLIRYSDYFSPKEIRNINKCRLYLRVLTLADIYECNGRIIYQKTLNGNRHKDRISTYKWPFQIKPS